jgi:hypothetical protein
MTSLLKTKTFWGGIASIITGISLVAARDIPNGVNTIALGLVAIFLRDAITTTAASSK